MPSFEVANRQLREVGEFSGEVWHARRDGTVFPGLMRNSLLRDNAGNPVGLIGTVRDITDIKQVEEQLRTSVREKEVLLREIHHRVKNNMQVISSLLNIQSTYFKDKRSMEMFKETQNRVTSMALVHEQLYHSEDMGRVEFEKHVRSLISHLFCSYGVTSGRVTLKTNIEDIPLSLDIAIPCGLIVNELASNALKHGFSSGIEGEIRIGLTFDGGQYTLVVFNNGKAFPVDLDFHATGTMGLQVVTTLARQLEGTVGLDRQGGTTFLITFPESEST
jgi:two-component sensor histidine kinase